MGFFSSYTQESCYWAGFIAADGCIRKDRPQLLVTLHTKDASHLDSLQNFIGGQVKNTSNGYAKFYISGAQEHILYLDQKFGIRALKSLIIEPPVLESEANIAAFIRGLLDGDGSITQAKNGQWSLAFLGTSTMMEWCKEQIRTHVPQAGNPSVEKHKSIYRVRFLGRQTYDILEWLYRNSTDQTRLQRKYERYLKIPSKLPKGITCLRNQKYMVRKTINGKRRYLGCFDTIFEAQTKYLES